MIDGVAADHYESDRNRLPHFAAAQQELINYGLRTVIDLRYDHECSSAPNVFATAKEVTYVNISLLANAMPNAKQRPL